MASLGKTDSVDDEASFGNEKPRSRSRYTSLHGKRSTRSKYWTENSTTAHKKSKLTQESSSLANDDESLRSSLENGPESPLKSATRCTHLARSFFNVPCTDLAQKLLGKTVVCMQDQKCISGRIVETEAYLGSEDKAAHSYQGKRTPRNEAMFMPPGTAYVYNIYGMYCCINISSKGEGAAVLIRALEAVDGLDFMRSLRQKKNPAKMLKDIELCNGPSKLCQALNISKDQFNKVDMTSSDILWLEDNATIDSSKIVCSARINIGYAEDWKDKPLRFYIFGNKSVSVRDRKAEQEFLSGLKVP